MKSILVVDDESTIRKYLRRILEPLGYLVIEASDGNVAIKQYNENKPDLVIMDIIMPGKEGIETIFELKQLNNKIKLIIMSGGGFIEPDNYLRIAETIGVDAVMKKPFEKKELLSTVREALSN